MSAHNLDFEVFVSAARTTTVTSPLFVNYNHKGIILFLDITATGATTLTIQLRMVDPITSKTFPLDSVGSLGGSPSSMIIQFYPGLLEDLVPTIIKLNSALSRKFKIAVIPSDANSVTYSIGASLIL